MLEGMGEFFRAMAQSMVASPQFAGAAGAGGAGGGNTYNVKIEVPLDVLRDEPHLQQNAETLAQAFMRNYRGS